ncbi:MAG TPA: [protein-PII] uridylyltransferase [Candidatus Binatia bacterium]|nr:[protein-PII] uridylyltransferase [Candidatus Binatia bacterium]
MQTETVTAVAAPPEPLPGLGRFEPDSDWGRRAKEFLARAKELLCAEHLNGASGRAVVRAYTQVMDHLVRALFEAATAQYANRYSMLDQRCTVIAQGGYGRAELNPCSDIDLLFLYPAKREPYVETVTEKILYTLWDTGLTVGHATRNVNECVRLAAGDLKVKTALLDARYICGDERLWTEFAAAMDNQVLKRNAARFYKDKLAENADRHQRYGDSVYLLEPQLKEGEGGLRDLHTAMWMAKVKFKTNDVAELVHKGVITERERAELESARDFLWRVRNALHFLSGQHHDQLTFDYQERIAEEFGYRDTQALKGVERFMRDYYLHAAAINRFAADVIERCTTRPRGMGLLGRYAGREIRPGVRIVGNELIVGNTALFRDDPSNLVRIFSDAQRHSARLSHGTKRLIRDCCGLLDDRVREDPATVQAFFRILGWKFDIYETLFEMHRLGVLGALIPEFGNLLCLSLHDLYHIYTVDQHSLMAVRELERLRQGHYKTMVPLLTEVMRDVDRAEILFLALLLHDAGKGQGGGHSEIGARMVPRIAQRMHLNADDAQQVEMLVRHHLLKSHLAQRRDVSDPKLVIEFAKAVGNVDNLKKLYLLTFADMRAVGPKVWSNWQDMLLSELYLRALDVLEKGAFVESDQTEHVARIRARVQDATAEDPHPERVAQFLRDMPDRYFLQTPETDIPQHIALVGTLGEEKLVMAVRHFPEREFSEFTVVTADQPGLFARITGVLTAHGMNIVGARINTSQTGVALDVFRISHLERADAAQDPVRWERVQATLRRVLANEVDVEQLVAAAHRPSSLLKKWVPRVGNDVQIDNSVSRHFTVLDVYAQDRVGLLFTITNGIYHLSLSIHLAKITTNVDQALDVFYVTENGRKIEDAARLEAIRNELLRRLQEDAAQAA